MATLRSNPLMDKPNVLTVARRKDCDKGKDRERDQTRLAWLLAPETAFTVATRYNTSMQDSTCNWAIACAKRAEATSGAQLVALATIAALPQTQT
jgi:hypothetical protein